MKHTFRICVIGGGLITTIIILLPFIAFAKSTPISCGQTISASISTPGEIDPYSYSASAGDVVDIRAVSTSSGLNPYLKLKDSHGTVLATASPSGNQAVLDYTLASRATYTIEASGGSGQTGNYKITLQKLNGTCGATALTCGTGATGSISALGDIKFYTISGTSGDKLTIRAVKTSGNIAPYIELYTASGTRLAANLGQIDISLTASGTYVLVVYDNGHDATGNYSLAFQKLNNPCNVTALSFGTIHVSIGSLGEIDFYSYTATASNVVVFQATGTSGGVDPYIELYTSQGTLVAQGPGEIAATLTSGQSYVLLVYDNGNNATGNYDLTFSQPELIQCNQALSGAITSQNQQQSYVFFLSGADTVKIKAIATSGDLSPRLKLYDPLGTKLFDTGSVNETVTIESSLTLTGNYIIVVSGSGTSTGNYVLGWSGVLTPCPSKTALPCNTTANGTIATPVQRDFYTMTLTANGVVKIKALAPLGAFSPLVTVYDSSGTKLIEATSENETIIATSFTAGTYTISVGVSRTDMGRYFLSYVPLTNPCNTVGLTCGQSVAEAIRVPLEMDAYSFTANPGDNVVLSMVRTPGVNLNPHLELYNNFAAKLADAYSTSDTPATISYSITQAGTYFVFASDYNNTGLGAYRMTLQNSSNTCPQVAVLIPNGGELIDIGAIVPITWTSTSPYGITSHEIRLSTDGGASFPTVVATGLSGSAQSFNWTVPDMPTGKGRIRVIATDGIGVSTPDDSDNDFLILRAVQEYSRTYGYDNIYGLLSTTYEDTSAVSYTYDPVGNRLTRTGISTPPVITANPLTLDFGSVPVGQTEQRTTTIGNNGSADLEVDLVAGPDSPFSIVSDGCSAKTIQQGENCAVTLRFSPGSTGPFSKTLLIPSDDPSTPTLSITLAGIGI